MSPPVLFLCYGKPEDLPESKLFKNLLSLSRQNKLPSHWACLLMGETPLTGEEWNQIIAEKLREEGLEWQENSLTKFEYFQVAEHSTQELTQLHELIAHLNVQLDLQGNFLFYPLQEDFSEFLRIIHSLGLSRPPEVRGFRRILLEMPLHSDLAGLKSKQRELHDLFREEQIFRRSYGLCPYILNALISLRFSNGIFEPLWNRHQIQAVEISLGDLTPVNREQPSFIEERLPALLQLLSLIAMDPPVLREEQAIRNEMLKVLLSLRNLDPYEIPELAMLGRLKSESLLQADIEPHESYLGLRIHIDNGRWNETPFYLRSAAGVPQDRLDLVFHFHPVSNRLFQESDPLDVQNTLVISFFPELKLELSLGVPAGQNTTELQAVQLNWKDEANAKSMRAGFDALLLDCLEGRQELFLRADAIESIEAWISPLKKAREQKKLPRYLYRDSEWGPSEAESLFEDLHAQWWEPENF
ncbi:hypothetical protein COW36_11260 [bacterium (Candidatus Blackallbacteria) CG17_big_fil_post_rev_8_21_14_2_50_48_46]|uniref:Uncharacterized protein n=1 Tax=bacterium (Candidatus Blackallbacteria) CG17_big_fil_post_rev_8_21_14_2_50_48_46 TaxID=2014261 RepID=A0A2M7G4M8_9BACT|nr:MAG: hypothetical protein COW64_18355 [bacterium (Candidatus Blackallbacteria) CG18_big_fil_WC_8_21_14_2_50_49_26]PIW16853.1 MAG: hypothetical protein COW36_11260 [bacterium (Candidatus Blackallbacteria) CG17_big_fil_post_rev_8_21_14_2_50_48_46]PIW48050.1 MAG: hypothetical protein COW20_10975 [bacterium (Candidatus Blackallbacteria) CG13_big_fil_rev_8_21_14_2_50_49_14]